MTEKNKLMINHYELLYLVSGNFTEAELTPIREKVLNYIKKYEGEISFEDSFGKKKLAYPIKIDHQGYYLIAEFNLDGAKLKDLEKDVSLTNEVLRHMVVKKKLPKSGTAPKPTLNMDIEPRHEDRGSRHKPAHKPVSKPAEMPKVEIKPEEEKDKLKLENLDEKLDEILEGDIM